MRIAVTRALMLCMVPSAPSSPTNFIISIAGAVVAVVGTGASIGFQFPYRKYRNQQYILEEKIRNLQELEETQTGLEDLVKEVIVD